MTCLPMKAPRLSFQERSPAQAKEAGALPAAIAASETPQQTNRNEPIHCHLILTVAKADQTIRLTRPTCQEMLCAGLATIPQRRKNCIQLMLNQIGDWRIQKSLQRGICRSEIANPDGGYVFCPFRVVAGEVKAVDMDQQICRRPHRLKLIGVRLMHPAEEIFIHFRACKSLT